MATLNIGRVRPVYRGEWDNTVAYTILDTVKVSIEGSSDRNVYMAVKDVPVGTLITNETYWLKLSVQGPKGDRGATGQDGAQGPQGEPGVNGADGTDGIDGLRYDAEQNLTADEKDQAAQNLGFWAGAIAAVFGTYELFKGKIEAIVDAYLSGIVKELILENGGTQEEIDAIEAEENNGETNA